MPNEQKDTLKIIEIKIKNRLDVICHINEKENRNLELEVIPKANTAITFCINGKNGGIEIKENDDDLNYETFFLNHENLLSSYDMIEKIVNKMEDKEQMMNLSLEKEL